MLRLNYRDETTFPGRLFTHGLAEGAAMAILAFLDGRGIEVPDYARTQIMSRAQPNRDDVHQLEVWARQVAAITTVDELFDAGSIFTQGMAAGRAGGRAEGEARAILEVLDARRIDVPDDAAARITRCTDLNELDAWARRVATIITIDELFD